MVRAVIFSCLFLGFYLLFLQGQILERLCILLKNTQADTDMAARQRRLENKRQLWELQEHHALWFRLERYLYYSGIRQRFSGISVQFWVSGNLAVTGFVFVIAKFFLCLRTTVIIIAVFIAAEAILLQYLRLRNLRAVNDNLMKLLNFLKNYSITAAEVTGVFNQVGRYMEEPIRTVLEECYLKARVTGDAGRALLLMEEKIEHPEFKELVRNIEISIQYCADFTTLVNSSRRNMREHMRLTQVRKAMLREAVVKLLLLMAMSLAMLLTAAHAINLSSREMLLSLREMPVFLKETSLALRELVRGTIAGKVGPAALGMIFLLFWVQLQKVYS